MAVDKVRYMAKDKNVWMVALRQADRETAMKVKAQAEEEVGHRVSFTDLIRRGLWALSRELKRKNNP